MICYSEVRGSIRILTVVEVLSTRCRDDFEDNERRITCAKEKNVINENKNSSKNFFSEKLRRDVAVSLEETRVI
jgi:hypothetical protein